MTTRARLAGAGLGCCVLLFAGSIALLLLSPEGPDFGIITWLFAQLAFAIVGGLIGLRRPGNNIGRILLVAAFLTFVQSTSWQYAQLATSGQNAQLPGDVAVAWLAGWTFVPGFVIFVVFLPLLFPTGRALSPRWRLMGWATAVFSAPTTVALALKPGPLEGLPIDNPVGIESAAQLIEALYLWGYPFIGVCGLVASSSLIVRFRRSSGIERQQLKSFGASTLLFLLFVVATGLGDALGFLEFSIWVEVATLVSLLLMPASIAVAILRYRLYDIDRIISRTLAYGALTAILAGGYLLAVLALQSVLPLPDDSPLIVAASTLGVVAAFGPLRTRVQHVVDRRFDRAHYDASLTIEDFGSRLRAETDLDSLTAELLATANRTLQPSHASLWLATEADGTGSMRESR